MSGKCQNCGHVSSDGPQDSPPNPGHCGHCPPWRCEDCGEMCSAASPCSCWTSLEGMNLADLKAVFARADLGLSVGGELGEAKP